MDKCSSFTLQRRNGTGRLLRRRQHLPAKEHSTMNKIPTLVVASLCLVLFVFAALGRPVLAADESNEKKDGKGVSVIFTFKTIPTPNNLP